MTTTVQPQNGARRMVDPETGEALALVPMDGADAFSMEQYLTSISSPAAIEQQQKLAAAYDTACKALIGPNDVQKDGQREFKKKSAWRKLQRHFRISTRVVSREFVDAPARGSVHAEDRVVTMAVVVVEASAPWGQTAEAVGACGFDEESEPEQKTNRNGETYMTKGKEISLADMVATAETRATNRAISNLIAMGEVSAEEIGGRRGASTPRPSTPSGPSERQIAFAEKLARSSALTEDQRTVAVQQIAKAKADGWDGARFSRFLDKLKAAVDDAEGAQRAGAAVNPPTSAAAAPTTSATTDAEPDHGVADDEDPEVDWLPG